MNILDLIAQKRSPLLERKATIDATLSDLDALERLHRNGVLTETELREALLPQEGKNEQKETPPVHADGGHRLGPSVAHAKHKSFRSLVWEVVKSQTGGFLVSQIVALIDQKYPRLDYKRDTIGAYLVMFAKEGKIVKSPSSKPGGANTYSLAS